MTTSIAQTDSMNAGGALSTVLNILDAWGIDEPTRLRLLGVPRSTYYRWRKAPRSARLDTNTLERLSYLLGIYKDLQILLPDPEAADTWPNRQNDAPLFGGQPPISRMAAGHTADLYVVRQFLDAARGGGV